MVAPKITVLMPVYNAERFLKEAIDSILAQTFQEFEFVIIDDGSTDSSVAIVESYRDRRIRFFRNNQNAGISETLNRGIGLASCELIARMDADDVSNPFRLHKQYEYMIKHPECGLLSAWARVITEDDQFIRIERYRSRYYYYNLTFECWMYHPTVVFRKSAVQSVGMYSMPYSEDYDLFWKLSKKFEIGNIEEPLVNYRLSPTSLNLVTRRQEYELANEQNVLRNIRYYMGADYRLSRECLECLRHNFAPLIASGTLEAVMESLQQLRLITEKILEDENPNLDPEAILEAYRHKRQFIISQLAHQMPVFKKLMLLLRTREWVVGYSLMLSYMKWQIKKVKSLVLNF
ncbi:MAG TPA: glycosyltransferase [Chryseosolibacter sp.]|nr:glycosyltransferase [Chryseosolibacter sp.]